MAPRKVFMVANLRFDLPPIVVFIALPSRLMSSERKLMIKRLRKTVGYR